MSQYLHKIFDMDWLVIDGTYIDSRRLSFNNGCLKENVLIYESKIFVKFRNGAGEYPLCWTTACSSSTLFHKCKDWIVFSFLSITTSSCFSCKIIWILKPNFILISQTKLYFEDIINIRCLSKTTYTIFYWLIVNFKVWPPTRTGLIDLEKCCFK